MPVPHRILVATDFSTAAERAVARAGLLAKAHGAALHLLHVVPPLDLYPALTLGPEVGGNDEAVRQAEQTRLDAAAAAMASSLGIRVEAATRIGRVQVEIAEYAKGIDADLVLVGARGENTLLDLLMGATASRLLRLLTRPVLVVRQPASTPYQRVLAALDLSPGSAEVLKHARALAGDASLQALHVLGSEVEARLRRARLAQVDISDWLARLHADAERRLEAVLAEAGEAGVARQIRHGLPSAVICQVIEEANVDLVVLGRYGQGGALHDWMLGSVSKDVAFATHCDVLLIGLPAQ